MGDDSRRGRRLRRVAEDLVDAGFALDGERAVTELLLDEVRHALHPPVHERRVASMGSIINPTNDRATWTAVSDLEIVERPVGTQPLDWARRFADGLSSWLIRRPGVASSWAVFDRPAGSERDLGVLVEAFGGAVVQRHPKGTVRVANEQGVWRWERFDWHHEPHVDAWVDLFSACTHEEAAPVLRAMLEFAVHDLGSLGIGAILIHRAGREPGPPVEARLPLPPALEITRPLTLAPLRHALAQVDGAAVFDASGTLRQLGVRLVPTVEAERSVPGLRGMRHTSSLRYSHDDPSATVIVVSEDGPVTVMRAGKVLGSSLRPRAKQA